jgi:hypothetical protein
MMRESKGTGGKSSNNSRISRRSTGSQTIPRGVQASSFQLPAINTNQMQFQLKKVDIPIAPVIPIAPISPVSCSTTRVLQQIVDHREIF